MSWLWADLVADAPERATAAVAVVDDTGGAAGVLAFWPQDRDHRPGRALRVDERLLAPREARAGRVEDGPDVWISWCRMDGDHSLAFDDGAVSAAIRRCLLQPWPGAVSTMLVDWSRIAGAVTVSRSRAAVDDDPFARVFPHRRRLRAASAAFGVMPAPTGPCITRYGSGNPWPWDRYEGQEP